MRSRLCVSHSSYLPPTFATIFFKGFDLCIVAERTHHVKTPTTVCLQLCESGLSIGVRVRCPHTFGHTEARKNMLHILYRRDNKQHEITTDLQFSPVRLLPVCCFLAWHYSVHPPWIWRIIFFLGHPCNTERGESYFYCSITGHQKTWFKCNNRTQYITQALQPILVCIHDTHKALTQES